MNLLLLSSFDLYLLTSLPRAWLLVSHHVILLSRGLVKGLLFLYCWLSMNLCIPYVTRTSYICLKLRSMRYRKRSLLGV
jgi:hypothetical protein